MDTGTDATSDVKLPHDLREPGVYFLFCKNEEKENDAVYIGEAENIYDRLVQHIRDYTAEKEKIWLLVL